jgi:transposase
LFTAMTGIFTPAYSVSKRTGSDGAASCDWSTANLASSPAALAKPSGSPDTAASGSCLSLPKIGDLKMRWSRPLPAEPSSVTVTMDGAGRHHASFVVEVRETSLPVVKTAVGADLGLSAFVALSDGRKEDNPRWLSAPSWKFLGDRYAALASCSFSSSRRSRSSRSALVKRQSNGTAVCS